MIGHILIVFLFFLAGLFTFFLNNLKWHEKLFYLFMGFGLFSILVLGFITRGESIRLILSDDQHDVFMDFFNSVQYGMHPYAAKVIYPPLINVFYGFLGRFMIIQNNTYGLRENQMAMMVFGSYLILTYSLVFLLLLKFKNGTYNEKVIFSILILFSSPFLFCFDRANSVILTLISLALFVAYRDDINKEKKFLSYIFLSISAGIKISPALFGILLIREKKYKQALVAFLIGVIFFFFPFIFTDGNIFTLIDNILHTDNMQSMVIQDNQIRMVGSGLFVNFNAFFESIGRILNYNLYNVSKVITVLYATSSIFFVLFNPELQFWKCCTLLVGIIVLCSGFSAIYNLVYFIIPLIAFLNSNPTKTKLNVFYLLLFIGIFIPGVNIGTLPIFKGDWHSFRFLTMLESSCAIFLVGTIILEESAKMVHRESSQLFCKYNLSFVCLLILCFVFLQKMFLSPVDYFTPGNLRIGNVSSGFVLENGLYAGIGRNKAHIRLNSKEILERGLTISFDNPRNIRNDNLQIFINGTSVGSYSIRKDRGNLLYIPAKKLTDFDGDDSLDVSIQREPSDKSNEVLPVLYIGPSIGMKTLSDKIMLSAVTDGIKKYDNQYIVADNTVTLLVNHESLGDGYALDFYVPKKVMNSNNNHIVADVSLNGEGIKSVNIYESGDHSITIVPPEVTETDYFSNKVEFGPDVINIHFRNPATFNQKLNVNPQKQEVIGIKSIGPIMHLSRQQDISFRNRKNVYIRNQDIVGKRLDMIIDLPNLSLDENHYLSISWNGSPIFDYPIYSGQKILPLSIPVEKLGDTKDINTLQIRYNGYSDDLTLNSFHLKWIGFDRIPEGISDSKNLDLNLVKYNYLSGISYKNDLKCYVMGDYSRIILVSNENIQKPVLQINGKSLKRKSNETIEIIVNNTTVERKNLGPGDAFQFDISLKDVNKQFDSYGTYNIEILSFQEYQPRELSLNRTFGWENEETLAIDRILIR